MEEDVLAEILNNYDAINKVKQGGKSPGWLTVLDMVECQLVEAVLTPQEN